MSIYVNLPLVPYFASEIKTKGDLISSLNSTTIEASHLCERISSLKLESEEIEQEKAKLRERDSTPCKEGSIESRTPTIVRCMQEHRKQFILICKGIKLCLIPYRSTGILSVPFSKFLIQMCRNYDLVIRLPFLRHLLMLTLFLFAHFAAYFVALLLSCTRFVPCLGQ